MTELSQTSGTGEFGRDTDFFSVGQPLHPVRGGYVRRPADTELYDTIVKGRYAYVIAPAHSGKSSLIAATSARLKNNGYRIATLDLSQIAERDGDTDAGRWYYSVAYRLLRQLRIKIDLQDWWQDKSMLSNRQRLVEFYVEVILQNIREPVVIFVDEIQVIENLAFKEHLLPSIRAAHNARATDPELQRLIFVISGECDPESLVDDVSLSPFAVSQAIHLHEFSRPDLDVFANELNLSAPESRIALDRVWHWTGGQPYLVQKLCRAVARDTGGGDIETRVDRIVQQLLAGRAAWHSEPHMHHIHRRIVRDPRDHEAMLNTYGRLRKGVSVLYDPDNRAQRKLVAMGLLRVADDGDLAVRNRIYEAVFTARWANRNLPLHWRGPLAVMLLTLLLISIPFWYTQLLPKPYVRTLVSPTVELQTLDSAWRNLRSFPGHTDTADRLFRNQLANRASYAIDPAAIEIVSDYAERLPDGEEFAATLTANFWDRQAIRAARAERRDDALVAALEALVVATPSRRRLAASLVGSDYTQLIATLPPQGGGRLLFSPRDMLISVATGARIMQWALQNKELVPRTPWTLSALEVTPLVRRVIVDNTATATRLSLRVNVRHARIADLRLKLIAPSGRTVDLEFPDDRPGSDGEIVFGMDDLIALRGEPLAGTWSLSLRDEATGVNGYLVSWDLALNSQGLVESFERGLEIPAPVERESNTVWFSPDGRYAIARAQQSDSARMWDLSSARPARTMAVPAAEQVLGLSSDARYLLTRAQEEIHLWRTVNGRREATLPVRLGGATVRLTRDGQNLVIVRRGDPETILELWSIEAQRRTGSLRIAGSPAALAIDGSGRHVAVADYDRAIRVWDMQTELLLAQLDQHAQPSEIHLAADGRTVAVLHGDQGLSLWRTEQPSAPVLLESGNERWQLRFSPSGNLLLAGNATRGFRVYRSADGSLLGPALDAGLGTGDEVVLDFDLDEEVLITAAVGGPARFWERPGAGQPADAPVRAPGVRGHVVWRSPGDSPATLSPGGEHLAIGDEEGHVHVFGAQASPEEISGARDDLNYIGHQGRVLALEFSDNGELIASAGTDGTVRIWDVASGLPRPSAAEVVTGPPRKLLFSGDNTYLAVLTGQRLALLDVSSGNVLANLDLGERHTDIAFLSEERLMIGTEQGLLRSLSRNRVGTWTVQDVYTAERPIRLLAVTGQRDNVIIVDAENRAQLLQLTAGQIAPLALQLPAAVADLRIAPGDSRVLFRTPGWIHRGSISPGGLLWLDAARVANTAARPQLVLDRVPLATTDDWQIDPQGGHLLLMVPTAAFVEVRELDFSGERGPLLFGTREELLAEWRRRLGRAQAAAASSTVAAQRADQQFEIPGVGESRRDGFPDSQRNGRE